MMTLMQLPDMSGVRVIIDLLEDLEDDTLVATAICDWDTSDYSNMT